MKRLSILAVPVLAVSACGSSSSIQTVQNNQGVQQAETKAEQQVSHCMPSSGGAPNPLLLRNSAERAKFETCTGVAKNASAFQACAFKVILGGLPTVAGVEKGLTACVEKNA